MFATRQRNVTTRKLSTKTERHNCTDSRMSESQKLFQQPEKAPEKSTTSIPNHVDRPKLTSSYSNANHFCQTSSQSERCSSRI
ncbi:unnamed protein product [Caenorhabditis sp. 36 PRJEB53466]|nr:unnamed protein product [Caenorhabditis sp. 36 PRJEB53466]